LDSGVRARPSFPVGMRPTRDAGPAWGCGPVRFAFDDLFTFRDDRFARIDSHVVPVP